MTMPVERVTVTLPAEVVRDIDRLEKKEGVKLAEPGLDEWARRLPDEDAAPLVDMAAGRPIRWVRGKGWVTRRR
jgi:hypothetical protein